MADETRTLTITPEPQPNRRRVLRIVAAAAGLPLLIAGMRAIEPKAQLYSWRGEVLGALSELSLWHTDASFARATILKVRLEIARLEKILSLYRSDSEIVHLNAAGRLTKPSPELRTLVEESRKLSQLSDGASVCVVMSGELAEQRGLQPLGRYMGMAVGLNGPTPAMFHLTTHAFFKALLFLGAGSVIHAMSGEQDMRNMGALAKRIPVTYWTMLVATLAIAGVPPLAGFFSKDEILWQAWTSDRSAYKLLWVMGWMTAAMTAFYMFRLITLTFFGPPRMSPEVERHVHESPRSMTAPLVILAFFSVFAGFLGAPRSLGGSNRFEKFLAPVFEREAAAFERRGEARQVAQGVQEKEQTSSIEYLLMFLSVAAGVGGILLGWRAYRNAARGYREPLDRAAHPVYTVLLNKYYVDEAYDAVFTGRRPIGRGRLGAMGLGTAMWKFDADVIDGAVNGTGWTTRVSGRVSSWFDKWIIDGVFVNGVAILTRAASYPVRLVQWGMVQFYALVMVAGLLGFVAYYVWR